MGNKFLKTILSIIAILFILGIILVGLFFAIVSIGFVLNLAYYGINGTFLGFELFFANWSEIISFWLFVFIVGISLIFAIIGVFIKTFRSLFFLVVLIIAVTATFGALDLVSILIDDSTKRVSLFESIFNTIIYYFGLSIINNWLGKLLEE